MPFEDFFKDHITIDGYRLVYLERPAEGPVLILIPGSFGTHEVFADVLPLVALRRDQILKADRTYLDRMTPLLGYK